MMKYFLNKLFLLVIEIAAPFTFLSSLWLKIVKKKGPGLMAEKIFMHLGILPVLDHYYQPLINPAKHLKKSPGEDRKLRGVDLNVSEQLSLLSEFHYNNELEKFPLTKTEKLEYYYSNGSYESGDSEYLYSMVRHFKPNRIIEIGSGNSTLMVRNAIDKNRQDDINYQCRHICIEPYEMPWLETLGIELIRKKIEDLDPSFFQQLEANDVLFIDSSHVIRPQGDVLFEYLEVLPILKSGVIVHIHDIFTPKDYPTEWMFKEHRLWNEQYLLEAFLTFNLQYKIIGALNYLAHNYYEQLSNKCPIFSKQVDREPGAFWIRKT